MKRQELEDFLKKRSTAEDRFALHFLKLTKGKVWNSKTQKWEGKKNG